MTRMEKLERRVEEIERNLQGLFIRSFKPKSITGLKKVRVSPKEIERRRALYERVMARRAKMLPLEISTAELIRRERQLGS